MNVKKVFIALIFMLLALPASIMAAPGGIFDGVIISSNTGVPISWATDGNNNTGHNIRNSPIPVFLFDEPTHISRVYIYGSASIRFYSDTGRKNLIKTIKSSTLKQDVWNDIDVENVRSIDAHNGGGASNVFLYEMDFKAFEPIEYVPVNSIKSVATHNSIELNWTNPTEKEFRSVLIESGGEEWSVGGKSKVFTGLEADTKYTFDVYAVYSDGKRSIGQKIEVKTKIVPDDAGEVIDLFAMPEHNRVDLSWILPGSDNFKHVKIYRQNLKKGYLLGVKTAKAATPIFETNGTYFNDLTVAAETKYEYTLTTLSVEKVESDGVSITVTTLKDPTPVIDGDGWEKDPVTGDYTYYWTEPTIGKVKVMVGGKLYATVLASDGKIVIPAKSMKYTLFGKPDVQLIPVDEEGNEGKPVKPPLGGGGNGDGGNGGGNGGGIGGGIGELPFTGSDLMKNIFDLLKLVGPYIAVVLAIYLAPRFIAFIKKTIQQSREGKKNVE